MIAYLTGSVTGIDEEKCLLEVQGVGYSVYCSKRSLSALEEKCGNSQNVKLFTQLIHREDSMDLYGFLTKNEYTFFNLLITVSGIGPKQAMKILGSGEVADIVRAITSGDASFLMSVSGIGSKKAQQIILELKEKLIKRFHAAPSSVSPGSQDVISVLLSLGFSPAESREAVEKALSLLEGSDDVSKIIETALKALSSQRAP